MSRRSAAVLLCCLLLSIAGCVSVGTGPVDGGERRSATVTHVVDGDTVDVVFADGANDTVRLLGVDAPETRSENEPGEYEGVPDTEPGRSCLAAAGESATAVAERHLERSTVAVVTDPVADRRGDFGRLLAYVELSDGTDLNYRLVERGYARVYDAPFSRSDSYYEAETEARSAGRGLWACREPGANDAGRVP